MLNQRLLEIKGIAFTKGEVDFQEGRGSPKEPRNPYIVELSSESDQKGNMKLDSNEDMGLFVRRYNRYLRKNEFQHSDKNLVNNRRQSKFPNREEGKTNKSK